MLVDRECLVCKRPHQRGGRHNRPLKRRMLVNWMCKSIRGTHSASGASTASTADSGLVGNAFDVELGAIGLEEEFITLIRGQSVWQFRVRYVASFYTLMMMGSRVADAQLKRKSATAISERRGVPLKPAMVGFINKRLKLLSRKEMK